jgi:ethanolamine ammonia-lyase small subunit
VRFAWARARGTTPARLDVGRVGARPRTATWLAFQRDHAAARDAVWSAWSPAFVAELARLGFLVVRSAAADRETYVRRPPLGRRLADGEAARIAAANAGRADPVVQVVVSDGLSARAAEAHFAAVWRGLERGLATLGPSAVPVAVVNGRVAVGDAVAIASGARLVVHLIGERPGLGAPDSLGCYVTLAPHAGTTDADRKCVSNIRAAGLDADEAGPAIAGLCREVVARGSSGTDVVL